jgi:hypothetical protein
MNKKGERIKSNVFDCIHYVSDCGVLRCTTVFLYLIVILFSEISVARKKMNGGVNHFFLLFRPLLQFYRKFEDYSISQDTLQIL